MNSVIAPAVPETLHALFEASVRRFPEAIALVDGELSLTYAQLEERAEAEARRLRALGIGPGSVVGLAARRSAGTLAALLGVLKAGAAYCPLDLAYPLERLRFMLEDSGAAALVAGREDAAKLGDPARPTVLLGAPAAPAHAGPAPARRASGPEDLAYVMYTSGSTGKPKGVMITHASAANYVRTMLEMDLIGPGERMLFFASLSFDVSIGEIFPCLSSGAEMHLRDDSMLAPGDFVTHIEAKRIERLSLPTAYWHELAATMAPRGETLPSCVRSLIVIGEALRAESLAYWRPSAGRVRFLNGYGPTETTVAVSFHDIPEDSPSSGIVPIGLPGAGAELRVIGPDGRPVPDGQQGELWIGGPGVARGYLNRAELTAERFVPDAGSPGARLYRSGDRVIRRMDGVFEYLGRFDDQVKIRGFRVELGEVESALASHPTVGTCAVILHGASTGDPRLVAYVSSSDGASASGSALRSFLLEKLPEYMVPAAVVTLPALPLTPNGKIDRRALLASPPPERAAAAAERAPTPLERQIRALWEEVLGISPVRLADDFFALGGHSLLAVRMMARIEKTVGRRPPLKAVTKGMTIESLARAMCEVEDEPIIRFGAETGDDPIFFVHPGLGGLYARELSRAMPERPFYLLTPKDASGPIPSIEEIARRSLETIRAVRPRGPYRLGGYSIGGTIAYEMARQLEAEGEPVPALVLVAPQFDVSTRAWTVARRAAGILGRLPGQSRRTTLRRFYLWGKAGELAASLFSRGGTARMCGAFSRALARVSQERSIGAVGDNSLERETLKSLIWAWSAYRPGLYRGSVTLLEVDDRFVQRRSPLLSRVAPAAEQIWVPGDHDSIVTTHVAELAAEIGRRLS